MGVHFLPGEGCALYRVLAEKTSDLIIRTERDGTIVETSIALGSLPEAAFLWEVVEPRFAKLVEQLHAAGVAGFVSEAWTEVRGRARSAGSQTSGFWYEMQIHGIVDDSGNVNGAVTILRSIDDRRSYEDRLFAATMTDPLTGLTNRKAFVTMLEHLAQTSERGCIAVFDIDHFKALNLRYGQAGGDVVLVLMADLLRTLTRPEDIISRVGGESFGVLMPAASVGEAKGLCQRIIVFLSDAAANGAPAELAMTASAGLAIIDASLDISLRDVELALAIAKAKGRNRLETRLGATLRP